MYADLKTISAVSLSLWMKMGLFTMEEFNEANKNNDYDDIIKFLNSKMDKLDFKLLQEKVKECIKE